MIWIIMGIALIFFLWLLYGYSMNFFLKTENYTINSPRIAKSFKAVLLADLHSASFGKKNEKLPGAEAKKTAASDNTVTEAENKERRSGDNASMASL